MEQPASATVATPTVRIAEPALHSVRSDPAGRDGGHSTGVGLRPGGRTSDHNPLAGGIYRTRSHGRSISRGSFDRRHSMSHDLMSHATHDVEEGDNWRDGDAKKKQIFRGKTLLWYVSSHRSSTWLTVR